MLDREPQPDGPAPVVDDDRQPGEVELLDEPRDRPVMAVVRVPAGLDGLVGAPEAEVVGRDDPRRRGERRDQLPVQVAPRRLAVEQQHGIAGALVDPVHPQAVLLEVVRPELPARKALEALVRRAVRHASTLQLPAMEDRPTEIQQPWGTPPEPPPPPPPGGPDEPPPGPPPGAPPPWYREYWW